jgi:hypothetical protein
VRELSSSDLTAALEQQVEPADAASAATVAPTAERTPAAELEALDALPGVGRDEIQPTLIDLPTESAKRKKDGKTA